MTPNVGALLAILVGLALVYVAVRGSQAAFFGGLLGGKTSTSSTPAPVANASPATPTNQAGTALA